MIVYSSAQTFQMGCKDGLQTKQAAHHDDVILPFIYIELTHLSLEYRIYEDLSLWHPSLANFDVIKGWLPQVAHNTFAKEALL